MKLSNVLTALGRIIVRPASAHCDTADGPAVTDGRRALESGNVNVALKWVQEADEAPVREAFDRARRVRTLNADAQDLADRYFLDVLVRIHRAGEGAGFDGIKPAGTDVPAQVVAADRALLEGSIDPLRGLIEDERWVELEHRFDRALELRDFDDNDLPAARAYMEAYVSFFKYAEGHDHDHDHGHGHAHQHAH